MSNKEEQELATVAMHEAGHVVVSHYYRRKVYGAKIGEHGSRRDPSVVRFELTPHIDDIHLKLNDLNNIWPLAIRETLVTAKIRFAGPISQAIYLKKPFREVHGGQDYRDALLELLTLERLRISLPNAHDLDVSYKHEDILNHVVEDIVDLLVGREYVNYVGRVARALIEKQELTGNEIKDVLHDMPTHEWD
jgi:hypothetical protein